MNFVYFMIILNIIIFIKKEFILEQITLKIFKYWHFTKIKIGFLRNNFLKLKILILKNYSIKLNFMQSLTILF